MKRFFLIPLLTVLCTVMAWADNIAQITVGENEPVGYETLSDLQSAIAALPTDGTVATIKLLDDINANNSSCFVSITSGGNGVILIRPYQHVILDLNGKKLQAAPNANTQNQCIIFVEGQSGVANGGGHLTITDNSGSVGTIQNTNQATKCFKRNVYARRNSSLHLQKCKIITNQGWAVDVHTATLTIEPDVEIHATAPAAEGGGCGEDDSPAIRSVDGIITINGGLIKSEGRAAIYSYRNSRGCNVTINGGTFYGHENYGIYGAYGANTIAIKGGFFNADPSEFIDQTSYVVDANNDMFEVKPLSAFENITVYTVEEMKNAFESIEEGHPKSVTMASNAVDFVLEEEVELPHGSVFIIPEGKSLTVKTGGLFVNEGITICNGSISVLGDGFFSKPYSIVGTGSISGYESALTIHDNGQVRYDVSNAMQLQFLSIINKNGAFVDTLNLLTDINLPNANFEMINYAPAVVKGNNFKINNLHMSTTTGGIALFKYILGSTIENVEITATIQTTTANTAILARGIYYNSTIKNVTLNGSVTAEGSPYALAAFAAGLNPTSGQHVWFVNCTNNATINGANGYNIGAFVGTMTGSEGELGLYNCVNNGVISGHNNVSIIVGHGDGSGSIDMELIAFSNNGSYSETSPVTGISTANGIKVVGASDLHSLIEAEIDPEIWTAVFNGERYIGKLAGVLDNKTDGEGTDALTTDWALSTTWTNNEYDPVIPNESDVVTVNNTNGVVVSDNTEAVAKEVTVTTTLKVEDGGSLTIGEGGLTIEAGATVTVEEGATLVVGKDGITIADGGHLVVEATEDGGTGVVLVDPAADEADARPIASVELIPDAYKVSEDVYKHRYVGIPLYFEGAEEFTSANWEREAIQDGESVVSHAKTWNNGWQDVTDVNEFVPFKGYALTNESTHGVKYTFKGKLVGNGDGTMNFAYGFNLFANSYTAPINIQTLLNGLSNNVKATIYMFDNDKLRTVSKADFAGFRTPKFTVIPSLQAFFVLMDNGTSASESINYAEAVYNNSLANTGLYAPKRQETPDFNRVRINIASENGVSDEVYLIEAADYTNDFENGFDEVKYMNNGLNLFATTAYGRQSTEITNDLNGTFIGVQGNGTYTMTFDELVGEEYQIRDLQTNAVVAMSEANTYTFTANGTNDARFVVEAIAKTPTALGNVDEVKMFVHDNTLFISENNSDANVMVYAANGQLVLSTTAQQTISLNGLANGVYTVRVANQTLKFVK